MHFPTQQSAVTTVPFHGTNLFVVERGGQPYVPMRPVVEGMGLDWKTQFRKLQSGRFVTCVVEMTTQLPGDIQKRAVTCLPLRKLMGWLMSIQPNKVKPEIRDKVIAYQAECDDVLWDYWTKGSATNARVAQQPVDQDTALTLSHKQVRDLDTVLRYAKMEFEPHDDCVDREFVNGKFKILHALVQSAMPARLPSAEPATLPGIEAPKSDETPDLPMHAGGYYAIIRDVPCLRLGDEVFLPLSPTCRAIGTAPACYHQSAAAREGSFLTSLPYRGQTRKLLMVPISYWEEKLGRARLRQPARGQLGGLLQEVRSGLFATVH